MNNKPYHSFLLSLFFILHVVNSYYGLIDYKIIFLILIIYFTLSLLLLLTGKLLFRKLLKAGCWATFILVIFFFFGSTHDFLKSIQLPTLFVSYTFWLPLLAIVILVVSIGIKRSKLSFENTNRYLNILFVIFVFLEVSALLYNFSTGRERENNLMQYNKPVFEKSNQIVERNQKPDIFFIVFDEYTSSLCLEKYFHYNNSKLDSTLVRNNFFISRHSKSNYNSTPFSIGSTLNMDYFNKPLLSEQTTPKLRTQAARSINDSQFPKYLHQNNYHIYNFGLFDLKDSPSTFTGFSKKNIILPFYRETLWGRIEKDILWNTTKVMGSQRLHKEDNELFEENMKNFELTLKELNLQNDTPKFVLLHLLMPHSPFVVDSNGNRINVNYDKLTSDYAEKLYLSQLIYTNKLITTLAEASNKECRRPRVVIIEGDHGYRDLKPGIAPRHENYFMNLNSYFFSDRDYRLLQDSISPVNSFRVVLNKYFNFQIPILKDSTILLD